MKLPLDTQKNQKFLQNLLSATKYSMLAQKLTNLELSEYLLNHIWPDLDFGEEKEAILAEIIDRLQKFP